MCWINKNVAEKHIADVPIECYKIALQLEDGTIKSYFERFGYEMGKCYKVPKLIVETPYYELRKIAEGFHSYSKRFSMQKCYNGVWLSYGNFKIFYAREVFYFNEVPIGRWAKTVLLRCTIPIGSTYYVNTDDCIVSDAIEITGIENIFKLDTNEIQNHIK